MKETRSRQERWCNLDILTTSEGLKMFSLTVQPQVREQEALGRANISTVVVLVLRFLLACKVNLSSCSYEPGDLSLWF